VTPLGKHREDDECNESDDIVAAGTRRIVGRAVLRRLSGMSREWQDEEVAKHLLAKRLAITIAAIALAAAGLLALFYR